MWRRNEHHLAVKYSIFIVTNQFHHAPLPQSSTHYDYCSASYTVDRNMIEVCLHVEASPIAFLFATRLERKTAYEHLLMGDWLI